MGDQDGLSDVELIEALRQLSDEAKGRASMPPKGVSQNYGGGYIPPVSYGVETAMDKAKPVVQQVLDQIVQAMMSKLSTLSRVTLKSSDIKCEVMLQNDKIVFSMTPLSRYGRLVFEEVKEQYTEEELKRG